MSEPSCGCGYVAMLSIVKTPCRPMGGSVRLASCHPRVETAQNSRRSLCRYSSPSMLGWRVGCFISLPVIASCRISLSVIASCFISVMAVALCPISLPICRPIFFRLLGTGRGALRLALGIQGLHGNDLVGSRLFLSVDRFQVHTVLLNFEFTFMADGEKRGMLRIQRTNVVFHFVGSEQILGT